MIAQFVKDLVHLERGGDGFDEHRGSNGPSGNSQLVLRRGEDVGPQPGLEVIFQFG